MLNLAGKVRVGLVGTALNEPEFDLAELPAAPASVRLPRTVRAGVAVQPIGMLTVAADYDLPLFAIRAGAFRDTEAPDPHWAYAAGVGLGLKILSVNAALVFSSEGGLSFSSTERRDVGAAVDARLRF
jgi:hypothetical protein